MYSKVVMFIWRKGMLLCYLTSTNTYETKLICLEKHNIKELLWWLR